MASNSEMVLIEQLEESLEFLKESPEILTLKTRFYQELVEKLKPKQNKIETRAITRNQLNLIIQLLSTNDRKHKG